MEPNAFNLTAFEFENMMDEPKVWRFVADNWFLSVWSSVVYVIVIFGGRWLMEKQEKFGLNTTLAMWSGALAIFSIFGTLRMWPEIIYVLRNESFYSSACKHGWREHQVTRFWTALFVLSKIIELGDTVFIVLRKQPLIFLHWYHHITVLIYTWYSYVEQTATGRWFISMNFAVHAVMYSYYALRALKFRVPNQLRMIITLLQLLQMVVGCILNFYTYNVKNQGQYCGITYNNLYYSFLMYFSYFILFAKFFYDAYISPPPRPIPSVRDEKHSIKARSRKAD